MKGLLVIVLVAVAVQWVAAENAEWGQRRPGDKQVIRDIVHKSGQFLRIVTEDVDYKSDSNISYIKVTDQYTNGNGGYATLYEGGVGFRDVTLHLKSQRGHGFNFIIEIYA